MTDFFGKFNPYRKHVNSLINIIANLVYLTQEIIYYEKLPQDSCIVRKYINVFERN